MKSGLGGVVFYDGGNVYSNINFRQFINNYTNSVGIGVRYDTPVGRFASTWATASTCAGTEDHAVLCDAGTIVLRGGFRNKCSCRLTEAGAISSGQTFMTKRSWGKLGASLLAVVVCLAVAGVIVLRSAAFHRYLLATIIEKAQAATGARVEIGDFSFSWSGLRIDFDRVVLHGTETSSQRPLVAADHLGVAVKILSLWKREIDLKEILLERPVVSLQVDQSGHNNLPVSPARPRSSSGNSTDAVFDLAIKHVNVSSGEVYYNDRSIPLSATFTDLPRRDIVQ